MAAAAMGLSPGRPICSDAPGGPAGRRDAREFGMRGYLTTHVLDTARGCPAEGLEIALYSITREERRLLRRQVTDADGRTDGPILPEAEFALGSYELVFHAGAYLDRIGPPSTGPRFLDLIPIRFAMAETAHYHVPLLLSPFGYSTYRGS